MEIREDDEAKAALAAATEVDFPGWDDHPLSGAFARRLYRQARETGHEDRAFAVFAEGRPVLLAPATIEAGTVSMFGLALPLVTAAGLGPAMRRKAFAAALDHLALLGRKALLKGGEAGELGPADLAAIDRQARPQASVWAVADLDGGEDALRRDVRDSFRSLINWGRRSLVQTHINAALPDRSAFDSFPAFHAHVAGRVVRPPAYWQVMWEEIAAGRAELTLAHLDGQLVAATFCVDAGESCYYASGVYDRERFDKPISHWPVFSAMLRAKERGLRHFDLGEIPAKGGGVSDKEAAIGYFKKGFSSRYRVRLAWEMGTG